MRLELLDLLCCTTCRSQLVLAEGVSENDGIKNGVLRCTQCARSFPITSSVPRFVPPENYASSFGMQWNAFRQTQLDSATGIPISRERFYASTDWSAEAMRGKWILDVGCGAGRFTEIALAAGGRVVAVDYSSAVDACFANFGENPHLDVLQADIYHLPFRQGRFDFVYCLGVLQHTPSVERAFAALPVQLKPGGRLAVDLYPKLLRNIFWSKYWIRPVTKRMSPGRLLAVVAAMVKWLLPISIVVGRIPRIGSKLRYALPIANYEGTYPLTREQLREWALLDTFDMLAPRHDSPQSEATVRRLFVAAGLHDVEVFRLGHLVGRGRRPI